jgi:nucleoside-diphosphate-sugar epimerase
MKNVLVLGDGLLGSEIVKQTGWNYISRKKDGFDICSSDYQWFNLHTYDIIINCIAFTDTYSGNKEEHWDINYKSVIHLSNFCETFNVKLVHISSDYVYANSIKEASEDDIPIHQGNWYSYTKLLGDSYVQLNPNNLVLRGTHKSKPFAHPLSWINQIGNFDYVDKISELIIKLINSNAVGLYNVGTELKTMSHLAAQTNPNSKPVMVNTDQVPGNVSMNVNKLNRWLSEN